MFFFVKKKTAYERRISDWSSDVCSSDLAGYSWRGAVAWRVIVREGASAALSDSPSGAAIGHAHFFSLRGRQREIGPIGAILEGVRDRKIGRASCRDRVCQ